MLKHTIIVFGCLGFILFCIGVALNDEMVPFPYWQHGAGMTTMFSVLNYGCVEPATVTINLLTVYGQLVQSKSSTIANSSCWLADTASWGGWYHGGDQSGWGYYAISATSDCVYVWSAVYGLIDYGLTGFSIVIPGCPYGYVPQNIPASGTALITPTPPPVPALSSYGLAFLVCLFSMALYSIKNQKMR